MKTMSCFAVAAGSATVQKSCTASSPARAAQRRQLSLRHAQNAPAAIAPNTMKPKKGDRDSAIGVSQGPGKCGKPAEPSHRRVPQLVHPHAYKNAQEEAAGSGGGEK